MNFSLLLSQILVVPDDGPIYRETTDLSQFIVEPWNAYSSLTFLIPAFYFLWKLRGKYVENAFLVYFCIPLLILGGLGSTFFHAFRSSSWLLAMDVLPIIALVLGLSIWMWMKVLPKKWIIIPIVIGFLGLIYLSRILFEGQDRFSAGYVVRGAMLLIPCFWFLRKTHLIHARFLFWTTLSLIFALLFRFADEKIYLKFMPWGTHWLWHVSTAFAAYFLGEYLLRSNEDLSK